MNFYLFMYLFSNSINCNCQFKHTIKSHVLYYVLQRSEDHSTRVGRTSHDRLAPGTWLLNILRVSLRFVGIIEIGAQVMHIRDSGCERYIIVFASYTINWLLRFIARSFAIRRYVITRKTRLRLKITLKLYRIKRPLFQTILLS